MTIKVMKHAGRNYVLTAITALVFLTTSCEPCKFGCPEEGNTNTKNEEQIQKRQEKLATLDKPYGTETGMIFGFSDGKESKKETATVMEEPAPYKDLSFRYALPGNECPFNIQSAHAQFLAGPNINFKSAGDDVYANGSHKPGIGFQAGFRATYRFTDKFSVVPGIFFKQNNANEEGTITDGGDGSPYRIDIEDKYSYSYLSAPVLVQYNLTEALSINAGPEMNYLLKSKVNSKSTLMGETHESKENLTKNSVKFGLGLQVGLRYQIPDSRVGLQLTYDHRLSRLNKKNPEGYGNYEVPAWRMKSVQLGVTLRTCDLFKSKRSHDDVID